MRRVLTILACVAMLVAATAAPAAAAGPPTLVTGTRISLMGSLACSDLGGGNELCHWEYPEFYSGDITGTSLNTVDFVRRTDGSFQGRGTEVCTGCTIAGRTGDFEALFVVRGSGTSVTWTATLIGLSGDLAGLRGHGWSAGYDAAGNETYAYKIHFTK